MALSQTPVTMLSNRYLNINGLTAFTTCAYQAEIYHKQLLFPDICYLGN